MAYKQCFTTNPTVRVTSGYPNYPGGSYHGAADIVLSPNTSIYAITAGTIVRAYVWQGGTEGVASWGNHIVVQMGDNEYWLCAHMARQEMSVGMTIQSGQYIGSQGGTGNVTGDHVHWEHWVGGYSTAYRVDPFPLLGIPNALGTYEVEWDASGNPIPPDETGDIVINPKSGVYAREKTITITTTLVGDIYYTEDGSYPEIGSSSTIRYSYPIRLKKGNTQIIVGVYNSATKQWSEWAYARYTIKGAGMPLWMKLWWY